MKFSRHALVVSAIALCPLGLQAQKEAPPLNPEAPKLTEAQATFISKQLAELEAQIQKMRGDNLTVVLQKLRDGVTSDQAAMKLYLDCENLVNLERKEVDRNEARRREENMQKNMDRKGERKDENEGDPAVAARLHIKYLILSLEANETSDENLPKLVPKLQEYIQDLTTSSPKLKGRALGYLTNLGGGGGGGGGAARRGGGGGGNSPIVEAFQISRYLNRDKWTTRATDIGAMYEQTILPLAEDAKRDSLPELYDARINAEGTFRKGFMHEPEYNLWIQNELPSLRWNRANYLFKNGSSPLNAMADMLKVVKENAGHADSPSWLRQLKSYVEEAKPESTTPTNAPPPADNS